MCHTVNWFYVCTVITDPAMTQKQGKERIVVFCKNCGKELPDTAKFCSGCGTPVAPPAPASEAAQPPVVQETPAAPVEDAVFPVSPVDETPVSPVSPAEEPPAAPVEKPAAPAAAAEPPVIPPPFQPAAPEAAESAPRKRRGASGMVVIGVGAVVAVVVVVLLFKLLSGVAGGGSKRGQAFAYLNDDYELMYLADLKEKTEAIEVTDEADNGSRVQFTADGKIMYFRDSRNALYRIAVSELKKDGRPERISRDVTGFTVLETGNVLYFKEGTGGREMNCYTGKDDFRVIRGYDSYQLSEDHKTVYYTEQDEDDGTYTLYKMALTKDAKEEELLDGATAIYTDFDSGVLVYGENDMDRNAASASDTDRNTLTVYSCKPGGEAAELIDEVYSVSGVKVDGSKVNFYYTVEDLEQYSLYDLISDSQQGADAALTAQELVRPDWYGQYYPDTVRFEEGAWYYITRGGEKFPVDGAALTASYGSAGDGLAEYQVRSIANNAAQIRYNAAVEEYNTEYEAWREANTRNQMRESLKNEEYTQRSYSLYQYNGAPTDTPIAAGVSQSTSAPEDGIFLYKKAAGISEGKVCDLSDLSYYGEVYEYLNTGSGDDDWYQNVGGAESVLELDDEETYVNSIYVLNGKEAVLDLSVDGDRWLDAYSIGNTALTFASTVVDDDFSGLRQGEDSKGNDVLYYFTDTASENYGTLGDFTRYSGGKSEVLAKEVYSVQILDGSGTMYAFTDIDRNGAELSLLQGDKPTVINDEVGGGVLIFLDDKQVLYTSDGDLYLWNGKEERRVAKDVEYAWANDRRDYTVYTAN